MALSNNELAEAIDGVEHMDSLEKVEFAFKLEDHFGIDISDEEVEKWQTGSDVTDMLTRLISRKAVA